MASLADELLNDFEDVGSEEEEADQAPASDVGDGEEVENLDAAQDERDAQNGSMALTSSDTRSASTLLKKIQPVLEQIAKLESNSSTRFIGSVEDNPEFQLLGQANTLAVSIDGEVAVLHKFIRDHYSVRFPELEQLVTNPLDYCKTVAIIGNGPMDQLETRSSSMDNIVGQSLKQVLAGPSLMVVTIEASTTHGQEMTEGELGTVLQACKMTLELDKAKHILTEFVQSRTSIFAPNLTALIGSLTAAQLLNYAGGLTGLAKTPACNVPSIGSKRQKGTGFATNVGIRHQGFLYDSPIVRDIPNDLKKQAMRIVSAKVILAARVDRVHENPDGSTGLTLKEECLQRLDKLTEPPPNKGVRALPAPDEKPSRKRGGRRARKAKEATAMTELAKAQNRMAFGKEEQEVGFGDSSKGLGMIGQGNEGRIRAQQIDQRTKAKLSKKNAGWGAATPVSGLATSLREFGQSLKGGGLRSSGVGSSSVAPGATGVPTNAGTSSTIAFTPVQGLELVDPKVREEMNRKRKADEDRWFTGGTFSQVGGGSGKEGGTKVDAAGFKVPALPATKKAKP